MAFINVKVQRAFFEILSTRREKRYIYGATPYHPTSLRILFDRCLNMISCHHPHIWSYGTGNLLVAPKTSEIISKAEERANEWRNESFNKQNLRLVIGNSFGFFIRYTLECCERMSIISNKLKGQGAMMYLQMFKYVNTLAPQLKDLCLNIKVSYRIGKSRYGDHFIEVFLTNDKLNWQIIKECNQRPHVKILRKFMFDTEKIAHLVIPSSLLYCDEKAECVVCLQEKDVLVWPCHTSHVTCTECTVELSSRNVSCPLCRKSIEYRYGKWYLENENSDY